MQSILAKYINKKASINQTCPLFSSSYFQHHQRLPPPSSPSLDQPLSLPSRSLPSASLPAPTKKILFLHQLSRKKRRRLISITWPMKKALKSRNPSCNETDKDKQPFFTLDITEDVVSFSVFGSVEAPEADVAVGGDGEGLISSMFAVDVRERRAKVCVDFGDKKEKKTVFVLRSQHVVDFNSTWQLRIYPRFLFYFYSLTKYSYPFRDVPDFFLW